MYSLITWFLKLCTLTSQCLKALAFFGNVDETVCGRVYRTELHKYERILNMIFWFDPEHCKNSHEKDKVFAKLILKYRKRKDD